MSEIIYLACPYSHPSKVVRNWRYETANVVAGALMREGNVVFSPLSHSVPIAEKMPKEFDQDTDFWLKQDIAILDKCSKMIVLCLALWKESTGVGLEIDYCNAHNIPIDYWNMEDIYRRLK